MRFLTLLLPLAAVLAGCAAPLPGDPASPLPVGWSAHAEGLTALTELTSATLGGKAYVVGGFTTDGAASRLVQIYDPTADAWTRGPDYPLHIHHAAAAAVEEGPGAGVYVLGGWISPPVDDRFPILPVVSAAVFRLAPGAADWTPVTQMPFPRGAHAAAALDGKIYVVGGIDARFELTPVVHIYDVAANTWSTGPPLPSPRDHTAAVARPGFVHLVSGQELSHARNVATHEALDVGKGEWVRLADLTTARDGHAAVLFEGRIVALGGQTDKVVYDSVEAYDPATDTWSALPPLPTARHGFGGAVFGDRLYVLLGGTIAGSAENLTGSVESLGAAAFASPSSG